MMHKKGPNNEPHQNQSSGVGRPTLPMPPGGMERLIAGLTTPSVGMEHPEEVSTGREMEERTRAVHIPSEGRIYPSVGLENPEDLTRDVRKRIERNSGQESMWSVNARDAENNRGVMLARDEYDETVETIDPEASTRSIREYICLISNLDERLDVSGKVNDQVRMILDELRPHLELLRRDARRGILKAFPVLFYPDQILPMLEGVYPKDEEVLPGVSKFQLAVRELGKALALTFKRETFLMGVEKLKTLKEKGYEYTFEDFRDTLVRLDDEPPQFTGELRYWLTQLTVREKELIGKSWIPPARPEQIAEHIKSMYPEPWHYYVLQIFGERMHSIFMHSSIPDDASVHGFVRQGIAQRIETEGRNIATIWRGELRVAENPPKRVSGRITDRVNKLRESVDSSKIND